MKPLLLVDQVAVITGGTAGIGRAIALKFAEEGARLALIGTDREKGAKAVEEIRQLTQQEVQFFEVDVSKTGAVEETLKKILESFKQIDILVNNAGVTADQLLMRMSEEEWDRVININLKSCYNTCHAVIRSMIKARKGKIINVSSVVGLMGNAGQANYAASKAGMIGFSKALAKEVAAKNIQVNCIAPGFIETPMTDKLTESQKENIKKDIPLGRFGNPIEVAYLACFLASDLSNYITGQVLSVDGGLLI